MVQEQEVVQMMVSNTYMYLYHSIFCLSIVITMYRVSLRDPRSHPPTSGGIALNI